MTLGSYIREARERLREEDKKFSLRQVALRVGVEPAYLSKIERELVPPPSEGTIRKIAQDLGEDEDLLLAMAGKVSSDLQEIIRRRPKVFAELIRELKFLMTTAIIREKLKTLFW